MSILQPPNHISTTTIPSLFLKKNWLIEGGTTNPSTPGVTTTSSHPKYQNNNINNNQMKMSENLILKFSLNLRTYKQTYELATKS